MHILYKKENGFTALVTVLLVSVFSLTIALTTIFLSSSESTFSFYANQSHESLQLADTCAEEAYFRLKQDVSYVGGSVSLGSGACAVVITGTGGSGSARTIVSSSTVSTQTGSFTRRITSAVTLTTQNSGRATTSDLTSWSE